MISSQDEHLRGSVPHFVRQKGAVLSERTGPYKDWVETRRENDVWPYQRTAEGAVGRELLVSGLDAEVVINFSSQDYLGLAQDERMQEAVARGMRDFGVHSAGSPAFCGSTKALRGLERKISATVGAEKVIVYPTGWAAGYGVPVALIRSDDLILMDALSHNCIQKGARASGGELIKFKHNDLDELERHLMAGRASSASRGIFVLVESLYSMDSDSPDLGRLLDLCEQYEAISILDVAHDFGSLGRNGRGLLDSISGRMPDVVLGSFSKTFAANGGFAAAKPAAANYLQYFSPTNLFSNAISPMQTYVANQAFDIAFSLEGDELRRKLMTRILALRAAMTQSELIVHGDPSPICPVFVGDEALARVTSKHVSAMGLAANLVEFPAVPRGKARFRFQLMANHEISDCERAADVMKAARAAAEAELNEFRANGEIDQRNGESGE